MAEHWKAITVRLYPDRSPDRELLEFLNESGSPVSRLRELWRSSSFNPKSEDIGTMARTLAQLRHVIDKVDTDLLLKKNISEEEYCDTLKSIEAAIRNLERSVL